MLRRITTFTIAVILLLSLLVVAAVKDTKHNFTSATNSPNAYFTGTRRVCVFCHTVHNSGSEAPLWNHETTNTSGNYQMYTSGSMDMGPGTLHDGSLVCLSCHDGTIAVNSLSNLPGPEQAGNYGTPGGSGLDGAGKLTAASDAYVGTDLTNDHPVGITYNASADAAGGFFSKTGVPTNYPDKLLSDGLYVECVSCHNPHDNTFGSFLVESNANSALCGRCHNK